MSPTTQPNINRLYATVNALRHEKPTLDFGSWRCCLGAFMTRVHAEMVPKEEEYRYPYHAPDALPTDTTIEEYSRRRGKPTSIIRATLPHGFSAMETFWGIDEETLWTPRVPYVTPGGFERRAHICECIRRDVPGTDVADEIEKFIIEPLLASTT